MAKCAGWPSEIEFLQKAAQMTDENEIQKARKEYGEQVKAAIEWEKTLVKAIQPQRMK